MTGALVSLAAAVGAATTAGTSLGVAAGRLAARRSSRGGGVVLAYHDVVAAPPVEEPLSVSVAQLRTHVRVARRLGFRFVPLADLTRRAVAGDSLDGLAAVAFDDALVGVAHHALPVLAELDVPATLMVVSTGWGRRPAWWPSAARTMDRAELREAVDAGAGVAAHTRTHASLVGLAPSRLRSEVAGSRADLEDLTGRPVDVFAYPFGHHDRAVREALIEAGYIAGYTFLNGRLTGDEDPLRLPRLTMGHHHTAPRLAYHLGRSPASWPDHQGDLVSGATHGASPAPG